MYPRIKTGLVFPKRIPNGSGFLKVPNPSPTCRSDRQSPTRRSFSAAWAPPDSGSSAAGRENIGAEIFSATRHTTGTPRVKYSHVGVKARATGPTSAFRPGHFSPPDLSPSPPPPPDLHPPRRRRGRGYIFRRRLLLELLTRDCPMGDVSLNRPINAKPLPVRVSKQGDQLLDLMSDGWTNERHSLYISSMEASFMEQLYGSEHHGHDTNKSHVGGSNDFWVLQEGVRNNLRSARNNAHVHDGGTSCFPDNPWIRRYRPRNAGVDHHSYGVGISVDDDESGTDTIRERVRTHGREAKNCVGDMLDDKSTGYNFDHLFCKLFSSVHDSLQFRYEYEFRIVT
ncbi:hypothetical protein GUJ93_ZPchr0012g19801 [Zizania palustris]|uniref:Uncharacterized protein n=1 Tax=Zizania palustris TaxID=103762 RepID=A0A8J6BUS4_ZIZPA|nr:hypothetical protein GUJ93_ZPchr0012g19801 [Zizania palustris]KAG8091348.1 hypothetical protein GUJ93_ZPchr0012g19801 [Zizania palustris]